MRLIGNTFIFALGTIAGASAYMGLESLYKNKYQVKKTINNAIDNMTCHMQNNEKKF